MTPEGKVKEAVKKRLMMYRVVPFVQHEKHPDAMGMFWMPVQGPYAVHGVHDFVGSWCGWFFSIETKAPDNPEDETANQALFREAVTKTGGIAVTGVRDASAVDRIHEIITERMARL